MSKTSVSISNLWLPTMAEIRLNGIGFSTTSNLYMWLQYQKKTFSWFSSLRFLTYWVTHSVPHTVLLAPHSKKAELYISDVKFLSSFGLSKSLLVKYYFIHNECVFILPVRKILYLVVNTMANGTFCWFSISI